jgi:stearoyl-CoA desaturase (delta-9 desaturase)
MMASKPQTSRTKSLVPSDGTTNYQPLRSGAYDMKKTHISELPMTWRNWYQHLDWLSIYFILVIPISGLIAATQVPLRLYTGIFAVAYYFMCGTGITAGMSNIMTLQGCAIY